MKRTKNKLIYFLELNLILKNKKFKQIKKGNKKIDIIEGIIKKVQGEFEYIIVKIEEIKNEETREKIIKNSDKIILFVEANYLGIKKLYDFLSKIEINRNIDKESLHILINKISKKDIFYKIIKQIFNNYKVELIKKL